MPDTTTESNVTDILQRLHSLPDSALLTPEEAGLYMNARLDLLRAWRWQGRGPLFVGRHHFIRYRKRELDAFLAGYGREEVEEVA